MSLDRNAPVAPDVEGLDLGEVIAIPQVGGLHHRYDGRRNSIHVAPSFSTPRIVAALILRS